MEQQQNSKKGLIVLVAIILVVLAGCLLAYLTTGDKGIEERFANAVGLSTEPDDSGGDAISVFGFNVEGNNLYYLIILAVLIVASFLVYKKFKL